MNWRRGLLRLGLSLAVLWFVFWTCAYVARPPASERAASLPPTLTEPTIIALTAGTLLLLPWIVLGFWPD